MRPSLASRRRSPAAIGALLAVACFAVYLTNLRYMGTGDSIPARLLPFSLLRQRNFDLDEFAWLQDAGPPYFLVRGVGGHWVSKYPVATAILVTPLYTPAWWWLDRAGVSDDDLRFRLASVALERLGAALIAAVSVALVFLALCRVTAPRIAAGISLAYSLGTETWSISSQALWQHGIAELSLAGLSLCLLSPGSPGSALAAGTFAALGFCSRSTMAIFAALAGLYVLREHRRFVGYFALPQVAGLAALLLYNHAVTGQLSGGQAPSFLQLPTLTAFAGLLLSPSRGLFVYTPAAALALAALGRRSSTPPWIRYALVGVLAYLVLFACWKTWWGGYNFGPRFLTDVMPALALASAPAVERLWPRRAGRIVLLLLAGWGVAAQAVGVYFDDGSWNSSPVSVDREPQRLWDWRDPQMARAVRGGWKPARFLSDVRQAWGPRPISLEPLAGRDLAGTVRSIGAAPKRYHRGLPAPIELMVRNDGSVPWPTFTDYGFGYCALIYVWDPLDRDGEAHSGILKLEHNVAPGEEISVHDTLALPAEAGRYQLTISLVQLQGQDRGRFGGASLRLLPIAVD